MRKTTKKKVRRELAHLRRFLKKEKELSLTDVIISSYIDGSLVHFNIVQRNVDNLNVQRSIITVETHTSRESFLALLFDDSWKDVTIHSAHGHNMRELAIKLSIGNEGSIYILRQESMD